MRWDPSQYARFAGERGRPFFDLLARVGAERPESVVDLGCGPGELTVTLAERWTSARVVGIDSSAEMIDRAPGHPGVTFTVGSAQDFVASGVDVVISNAMLQWVPGHPQLLTRWADELNREGWLAFQVPANFGAPSHALMRELAASASWRDQLPGVLRDAAAVLPPAEYLELLSGRGLLVEVWQTEYLHVLQGDDPVLEWLRGTGLRPVLAALPADAAADFSAEFGAALRRAYPRRSIGTVFPFRRTFVVGHKS